MLLLKNITDFGSLLAGRTVEVTGGCDRPREQVIKILLTIYTFFHINDIIVLMIHNILFLKININTSKIIFFKNNWITCIF